MDRVKEKRKIFGEFTEKMYICGRFSLTQGIEKEQVTTMKLLNKFYLRFIWQGRTFVKPERDIRITRTYSWCGKNILDITWCLRDFRDVPREQRHRSSIISERTSTDDARACINRVEKKELPKAIEEFRKKLAN